MKGCIRIIRKKFRSRFAAGQIIQASVSHSTEVCPVPHLLSDNEYHWVLLQRIHVDNPYTEEKLAIFLARCIDDQKYEEEQQRQVLQNALTPPVPPMKQRVTSSQYEP